MDKPAKIKMPDLTAMTIAELKALEKKVAKAITGHEAQQKKKALAALQAKAKELGYSLSDLTGVAPKIRAAKKPRVAGVAKYANPADSSQTWTGKGRRPAWVIAALEAGKSLDDLAI